MKKHLFIALGVVCVSTVHATGNVENSCAKILATELGVVHELGWLKGNPYAGVKLKHSPIAEITSDDFKKSMNEGIYERIDGPIQINGDVYEFGFVEDPDGGMSTFKRALGLGQKSTRGILEITPFVNASVRRDVAVYWNKKDSFLIRDRQWEAASEDEWGMPTKAWEELNYSELKYDGTHLGLRPLGDSK